MGLIEPQNHIVTAIFHYQQTHEYCKPELENLLQGGGVVQSKDDDHSISSGNGHFKHGAELVRESATRVLDQQK